MDQLTALRAYARLVELESFTAVAGELRVKQSTVSKWLAAKAHATHADGEESGEGVVRGRGPTRDEAKSTTQLE